MNSFGISKIKRIVSIGNNNYTVPKYIVRVTNGWQVRVRHKNYSKYFADTASGGAAESLKEATKDAEYICEERKK